MMRIIASYGCTKYTTNSELKMGHKWLLALMLCISSVFLSATVLAQDDEFDSLDNLEDLTEEVVQEEAEPEQDVVVDEEADEEADEEDEPEEPVVEEEPGPEEVTPSEGAGEASDPEETTASDGESQETTASTPGPVNRREISAEYVLRLQELEDRVNDLKEQIFRSKSRLVLLRERILGTRIGGSQARIMHINDMSNTFELERVIYSLDGNQLYAATSENDELNDRDEIELYDGQIVPGPHNVSVEMVFVGNGFGLFSYLEGYRFRLRSSYAFTAEDGKVANLRIVGYEQGGVNQPIEERPDIRYELEFLDVVVTEEE